MKKLSSISLPLMVGSFLAASAAPDIQSRSDSLERPQPAPLTKDVSGKTSSPKNSQSESDTGAQRPISLKKDGISAYFGYDSKYFYRSNPLATQESIKQPTGMWTNTFYGGAGIGVYDMDTAVVTPYIGGSWTINDYAEGNLGQFNYNSTNVYALLLAQYGNGWSIRAGVSYAMDRSTELDEEIYRDYVPNIGAMKAYSLNPLTTAIFDASISLHKTNSDDVLGSSNKSLMDSIEYAASYGIKHTYGNFIIAPKYKIVFKQFEEGRNQDRDDLAHIFSLKLDYPLSDSLKLSGFGGYTTRDSNDDSNDYDSYDAGAGIGLSARF